MNSLERLRNRLEDLLSGLMESAPRTGSLAPARVGPSPKLEPDGFVWECDPQGRYVWCSPEIERILGYPPEELRGKEIRSIGFLPPKADELHALITAGKPIYNIRLQVRTQEGNLITVLVNALARVEPSGERIGYRGVAQVVEVHEPEREILPQREVILSVEPPAVYEVPPTPGWGQVHGYIADEAGLHPISEPEESPSEKSESNQTKIRIPIKIQEQVLGCIDLEEPLTGKGWDEQDVGMVESIAQDLGLALQTTQTHQITQRALDEMREADRLKSQFLANMSHELRTPLNSIIGFSRVILKGIDGPITETQEQDLQAIYNAGQHLLGLINDILDVSRIEAGKMELTFTEIDLKEIIRGVMSTAVGLVKDKPIRLDSEVPEDLPNIRADNIRVRQVLLNLVSNAAKFTQEGEISLTARVLEEDGADTILITVSDTGPGIEPEDQEKLFEPFSQVDDSPTRKTGGTGLGLSICRHLVELHGGRIWVDSVPGEGSIFAFTLPVEPQLPDSLDLNAGEVTSE